MTTPPVTPNVPTNADAPDLGRFVSLRWKFGVFFSLIIAVTCSTLSWYFIYNKRESMTQQLIDVGTILTKNLAYNPRMRFALVTNDQQALAEFMDGVLAVEEVVYVVISGSDGQPLLARSKGQQAEGNDRRRSPERPLYPELDIAARLSRIPSLKPLLTPLIARNQGTLAVRRDDDAPRWFGPIRSEPLLDFALPVLTRQTDRDSVSDILPLESEGIRDRRRTPEVSTPKVLGLIQVGLTESTLDRALLNAIGTAASLTVLIILSGILGTIFLTNRIVIPLRSLASVARRVTGGDLTAAAAPTTSDEIGQLTWLFNNMTQSLKERDEAISANLSTISNQVRQLTTLNQASTAISSSLDLDRLLTTVLQLMADNLGFVRTIVVFYDAERGIARTARVSGVPETIGEAASKLQFPVTDDGSLHAEVLLRGKPLLIPHLESVAHRLPAQNLSLMRQLGMTSFVAAPLRSTQRILGYVGADKGGLPCSQEDLDVLTTMASHVAVAIDNAQAYSELGTLTATLEQRVQERTHEIQAANVRLKELDQLKSAFVSIVSHELRTPMTAIRGYIDNMLDGLAGPLTEKQGHYLNRVKINADRLTHMISELLDLSRIEAGRVELTLSIVDLSGLVSDVVEEFQRPASEKGIRIEVRAQQPLPSVQGDRNKLHQVLTNLIGNAMKFTPPDGHIGVQITTAESGMVHVTVSDSGPGISPDELPRIFEKFFRGSNVPPETRGAGLGLAIVRTLIELHGGRVWVESTVGHGSRFCFSVPLDTRPAASSSK